MNFDDERERWRILSRELAQKQELIHMTLKQTRDQEALIAERGEEMVSLIQGIKHLQATLFKLDETLRVEE